MPSPCSGASRPTGGSRPARPRGQASVAPTLRRATADLAKVRAVDARLPHPLRSDARDNRDLILDAARAAFAADGLNVPMREIARRAGVGQATLYRRFPTKQTLVAEAFKGQVGACHGIVAEGVADPDPWRGFRRVIEKICELHARDRGFTAAFISAFPNAMDFAADREYALRATAELARRAKEADR